MSLRVCMSVALGLLALGGCGTAPSVLRDGGQDFGDADLGVDSGLDTGVDAGRPPGCRPLDDTMAALVTAPITPLLDRSTDVQLALPSSLTMEPFALMAADPTTTGAGIGSGEGIELFWAVLPSVSRYAADEARAMEDTLGAAVTARAGALRHIAGAQLAPESDGTVFVVSAGATVLLESASSMASLRDDWLLGVLGGRARALSGPPARSDAPREEMVASTMVARRSTGSSVLVGVLADRVRYDDRSSSLRALVGSLTDGTVLGHANEYLSLECEASEATGTIQVDVLLRRTGGYGPFTSDLPWVAFEDRLDDFEGALFDSLVSSGYDARIAIADDPLTSEATIAPTCPLPGFMPVDDPSARDAYVRCLRDGYAEYPLFAATKAVAGALPRSDTDMTKFRSGATAALVLLSTASHTYEYADLIFGVGRFSRTTGVSPSGARLLDIAMSPYINTFLEQGITVETIGPFGEPHPPCYSWMRQRDTGRLLGYFDVALSTGGQVHDLCYEAPRIATDAMVAALGSRARPYSLNHRPISASLTVGSSTRVYAPRPVDGFEYTGVARNAVTVYGETVAPGATAKIGVAYLRWNDTVPE